MPASVAARSAAAARLVNWLSLASTSTILQFWQIAWTVSTSSAISTSQPGVTAEPTGAPRLTFLKQLVVMLAEQFCIAGRPYFWLYVFRSARIVLSSNASTIATVTLPEGACVGRLYAVW